MIAYSFLFFIFLFLFHLLLLPLLVVFFYQSFSLLFHHFHPNRPILFRINFISLFDNGIIFIHFSLILSWKYFSKPSQMFALVLISQSLGLLNSFFSFFPLENLSLPSNQPLLIDVFHLIEHLVFLLNIDIEDIQCIFDEIELNQLIQRSISCETWSMIDF